MLGGMCKVVFSSTLTEPLERENSTLIAGDAAEAVREKKENGDRRCAPWAASRCAACF